MSVATKPKSAAVKPRSKSDEKRVRPPKGESVRTDAVQPEPVAATSDINASSIPATRVRRTADTKPLDPFRAAQRAAILLKQVSDPTRLQVVAMLAEGEMHVGAICEVMSQSQPAISHHLALMRHGGIIEPRRQGKNNFYGLSDKGRVLAEVVGKLTAE